MAHRPEQDSPGMLARLRGISDQEFEVRQAQIRLREMEIELERDERRYAERQKEREHQAAEQERQLALQKSKQLPSIPVTAACAAGSLFIMFGSIALKPAIGRWPTWGGFFFGLGLLALTIAVVALIEVDRKKRAGRW